MNKLLCSCCICKNTITTNQLPIHYGSKQCKEGTLFNVKYPKKSYLELKCNYCNLDKNTKNSLVQHELYCIKNPNRKQKTPSYGMLGKRGSNQFVKARRLGLPIPKLSASTKEKMQTALKNTKRSYSSKEANTAINALLQVLSDLHLGKVFSFEKGGEFWLTKNRVNYFYYDCCFFDLKIIIEYQGIAYHPKSLSEDYVPPYKNMGTKEQIWNKDRLKESLAIEKGFAVYYIWSDNSKEDIEKISKIIRQKATGML